jgi:spore germination protein GerM
MASPRTARGSPLFHRRHAARREPSLLVISRRVLILVVVFVLAAGGSYWYFTRPQPAPLASATVRVFYTKPDGETEVPYDVTLGTAHDEKSVLTYAATQCLAGPPQSISAVRFPDGTHVLALDVQGKTVDVDLSGEVKTSASGGFAEEGEFKALVWTLTDRPGIEAVRVRVDGVRVPTLPGGHLELDQPLSRASF